jgi:hypothetical protein
LDNQVPEVSWVSLVLQEHPVREERLDHKDNKVLEESQELQEHQVLKASLDHKGLGVKLG